MQRVKRRIIGGLSGLGLAAGVLGATAGPAGAQAGFDMTCTARPDTTL